MVFLEAFLQRFAIPLTVAGFFLADNPGQFELYDNILLLSDRVLSTAQKQEEGPTEVYDFIIIGAGSAGAVVANRLSESRQWKILVLEAGGDPNPLSDIPYFTHGLRGSAMNYGYETIPQIATCGANQNICKVPRGKALGGSSTINGVLYNRCSRHDYDFWANFTRDPVWAYSNVMPVFLEMEDYHGFYNESLGVEHGVGGPVHVGKLDYLPSGDIFFDALREKNIPAGDLNAGQFHGFGKIDYTIKNGLRWGTYQAYIQPALNRANLTIYRYSTAQKIHFNSDRRAVGVTYERHGQTRYVEARNEIIVSAGVIDSPKLLMLSGIGPSDHLEEVGIESLLDLPVGSYLQDHAGCPFGPILLNKTFGSDPLSYDNVNEYIQNQTGPLSDVNWNPVLNSPALASGYWSSQRNDDPRVADLHLYVYEKPIVSPTPDMADSIEFSVELSHPNSVGSIRLNSSDPNDPPRIDLNMLTHPTDMLKMIDGVYFMLDIFQNTTAYAGVGATLSTVRTPGCSTQEFLSPEYMECHIRYASSSFMHATSTCRMGPNATVAVVDSKLKVFGTTGLRVIDASIIPQVPNGNTNIPSILVGEMGSKFILDDWRTRESETEECNAFSF